MREIKFRVWNTISKIMKPFSEIKRCGVFAIADGLNSDDFIILPLKNSILNEYTGLKDKNGVEIYEGDILELIDWYDNSISIHPVLYKNSAFMCQRLDDKEFPFFYLQGNDDLKDRYKIIGNIYENPELLKEE